MEAPVEGMWNEELVHLLRLRDEKLIDASAPLLPNTTELHTRDADELVRMLQFCSHLLVKVHSRKQSPELLKRIQDVTSELNSYRRSVIRLSKPPPWFV